MSEEALKAIDDYIIKISYMVFKDSEYKGITEALAELLTARALFSQSSDKCLTEAELKKNFEKFKEYFTRFSTEESRKELFQ